MFVLLTVMVGVAAAVALSTREDPTALGQDREREQAFYAAEYAVARAKDQLAVHRDDPERNCEAGAPRMPPIVLYENGAGQSVRYRYCLHDDVIEAFGLAPNNAEKHLTVTVDPESLRTMTWVEP